MLFKLIIDGTHKFFNFEYYDPELVDLYHLLTDLGLRSEWVSDIERWLYDSSYTRLESNSMFAVKVNEDVIIGCIFDEELPESDYSKCLCVTQESFTRLIKIWKEYLVNPPEVFTITLENKDLAIFPGKPEAVDA